MASLAAKRMARKRTGRRAGVEQRAFFGHQQARGEMPAEPPPGRLDALDLHEVGADAEDHAVTALRPARAAMRRFISATAGPRPVDDRARDDRVADVELDELGDRRDRPDVVVVEAVAGVARRARGRRAAAPPRRGARARAPRSAPCASA